MIAKVDEINIHGNSRHGDIIHIMKTLTALFVNCLSMNKTRNEDFSNDQLKRL